MTYSHLRVTDTRADSDGLVNLAHLDHLTEKIYFNGDTVAIVHIYSDASNNYAWVNAPGEGIAAVDDAARAAIAYLMHYEKFRDVHSLIQAELLLQYLFAMQASDGGFFNFIDGSSGSYFIVTNTGSSNNDGFPFWSCRALWALGSAYNVFSRLAVDPGFKDSIRVRLDRALTKAVLYISPSSAGRFRRVVAFDVPENGWLLNNCSNASAEAALGATYYYEVSPNEPARRLLVQLCDGIAAYQRTSDDDFLLGMFPACTNNPYVWRQWGTRQTMALALASRVLKSVEPTKTSQWLHSARLEADHFLTRMLTSYYFVEVNPVPYEFNAPNGEQAQGDYLFGAVTQGFIELARTSGDPSYAQKAGLFASWWLGNNVRNQPMYDSLTGRVYDGLLVGGVNFNSGGESAAEGLIGIQSVVYDSVAHPFIYYRSQADNRFWKLEAENFTHTLNGTPTKTNLSSYFYATISGGAVLTLKPGDRVDILFEVSQPFNKINQYYVYAQYMRRTDSVGIRIEFDNGVTVTQFQGGAGLVGDHIWMQRVAGPMTLTNGSHSFTLSYEGSSTVSEAIIDYFLFVPATARKVYQGPAGQSFVLEQNIVTSVSHEESFEKSDRFRLEQNFPNPFNPRTLIQFELGKSDYITLTVFDVLGREIAILANGFFTTGEHLLSFDASAFSSGTYFYRLSNSTLQITRKMILLH